MDEGEEQIEHTLYVNREVKVYRIPPRPAAGAHSSGTWLANDCIFTGRLRMVARGHAAEIRLEDAASGELFALCPFTAATQAVAIEPTADSSRYYVLRVEDQGSKRHAFLGLGFADRGDAFDFNAAVADHAKQCRREDLVQQAAATSPQGGASSLAPSAAAAATAAGGSSGQWQDPELAALYRDPGDLSLKEGQTLKIQVKRPHSGSAGGGFLSRHSGSGEGAAGLLRPPSDSGGGLPPPPVLLPPPGDAHSHHAQGLASPPGMSPGSTGAASPPPAVTVASSEEGWAKFD